MDEEARQEAARRSKKFNAAFLLSQEKSRKQQEIEVAQESLAERRRLAKDAAEFERSQRKEAWRARKAGRALRDSRREQVKSKGEARLAALASAKQEELLEVERIRQLDRAEAWKKEQAKREAREKNRLNKEDNRRLILMKVAEREENLREEHRMQMEYSAKMDADEEKKRVDTQKVLDRKTNINERMSAIYDRFKAQEDSVEVRADEEQRIEMQTDSRRAQEKEMKRVQLLKEQTRFLQKQQEALQHRLAQERLEDLTDAAEMKRLNRQARLEEKEHKRQLREEAIRIQSLLKMQIAEKASNQRASGAMTGAEKLLNRPLLCSAAVTMGLA
eukprot:g9845.t1